MTSFDVVVLAGGASRRMGHDKALLEIEGQRLVDHLVEGMAMMADHVVVASGHRSLGRADEVADPEGLRGPLAGLVAGLRATSGPYMASVPVDAPRTSAALVARLVEWCDRCGRGAVAAVADGHLQALHLVIARDAVAAVEERVAAGEWSPRRLLGWLDAGRIDVDGWGDLDPEGAFARDWDEPADLPDSVDYPRSRLPKRRRRELGRPEL